MDKLIVHIEFEGSSKATAMYSMDSYFQAVQEKNAEERGDLKVGWRYFDSLEEALAWEKKATCIGCGCTDSHSCPDGCSWVWVKRDEGRGWCSSCDDGDWEVDPEAAAASCAEDNAR